MTPPFKPAASGTAPSVADHRLLEVEASRRPKRIAIVGGGLAGLAAAVRISELSTENSSRQNDSSRPVITLLERAERCGGVIGTRQIGGYTVELGADSFITNKPHAIEFCKTLGLADDLMPTDASFRRSLVLCRGKPVAVPEGFQLMAPSNVWAILSSPIFTFAGKLRLLSEYFVQRRTTAAKTATSAAPTLGEQRPLADDDESLAAFVRRRFGSEALDRLVQPLVGGIYTSNPEKLSLRATLPRFLDQELSHGSLIAAAISEARHKSRPDRSDSGARYSMFLTLRNGIGQMLAAAEARAQSFAEIRLNTEVTKLSRVATRSASSNIGDDASHTATAWQISSRNAATGEVRTDEPFDAVILAIPAYAAAELLAETDRELSGDLAAIEYASTAIVVSGHKLTNIRDRLNAFGLVIPAIEQRRILAVSFTSRKFPSRAPEGCVELRTFVGGAMQPELLKLSDAEICELVREELRDLLGVNGAPDFEVVARWNRSMPQYHLGHPARVRRITDRMKLLPGLLLAGNALNGVGIPDVIHSGTIAADAAYGA